MVGSRAYRWRDDASEVPDAGRMSAKSENRRTLKLPPRKALTFYSYYAYSPSARPAWGPGRDGGLGWGRAAGLRAGGNVLRAPGNGTQGPGGITTLAPQGNWPAGTAGFEAPCVLPKSRRPRALFGRFRQPPSTPALGSARATLSSPREETTPEAAGTASPAIPHVPAPETITLRTSTVRRRVTCEADRYAYAHRTAQDQSSLPIAFRATHLHCCHIRPSRAGHDREARRFPPQYTLADPVQFAQNMARVFEQAAADRPARGGAAATSPNRRPRPSSRRWSRCRRRWAPWPRPT